MLFLKFIFTNHKENIAMDRFTTSTFPAVDYPKPARFCMELSVRYMACDPRHHINLLSFLL